MIWHYLNKYTHGQKEINIYIYIYIYIFIKIITEIKR